jgi:hypothetical protein
MFTHIPDPTTALKEEGGKFCCPKICCSYKYHKIVNNLSFLTDAEHFFAKTLER